MDRSIITHAIWYKYIVEPNNLLNRKPILYLGRDRVNGAYYFLGDKEGVGRFIKYLVYPMWCTGSMVGNFLDLGAEVPTEILEELMLFVNHQVDYELLPAKRGRAEAVVRTELATGNTARIPTKNGKTSEGLSETPNGSNQRGSGETRRSSPESAEAVKSGSNLSAHESGRSDPGFPDGPSGPRRRGSRSSRNAAILGSTGNLPVVQTPEANTVQVTQDFEPKPLASQNGEQPVKRGRGRPRKVKPLD